jgi:Type IIA topoisomerase (DNA gyrase/topo II, topoisomerase IV), A subunit
MVNKARLIEKIADMVKDKKIDGITALRDESNKEGMRIVIELRRDVNANIILKHLYKHTQLQDTFGVIMLALVNNEPKVLNLKDMLDNYLHHQEDVITRRTKYDLNKAEERAHILEGYLIALDNIDEVIKIIRSSRTTQDAKNGLMEKFGLSDRQAQAIVDMRLRTLTGLARQDIENEYAELKKTIDYLKGILSDEKKLLGVIREEILEISAKYGDDRRTSIGYDEEDITVEDLIPRENTVIAMTKLGYIKRMTVDNFKSQNRGGKGIKGMQTINDDYIVELMMTTTHHNLMFITNTGRAYKIKAYEIPDASRTSRGIAIVNLIQMEAGEKVTAMFPVSEFNENSFLLMVTKNGIAKKTPLIEYANIRKKGLQAISLRDDDELIEVKKTQNNDIAMLITKYGQCIKFKVSDVRRTGRNSIGVRGINLAERDEVVAMQLESQGKALLFVTENGMGKRTLTSEFTLQRRGGKGLKCYKINEKTGNIVGVKAVNEDNEIMLITTEGIIIQMQVGGISILSRITSGVKLMDISKEDIVVASIAKVRQKPEQIQESSVDIPDEDDLSEDFEEDMELEELQESDPEQ